MTKTSPLFLISLLLLSAVHCQSEEENSSSGSSTPMTCLDVNGNAVDWWILVKAPEDLLNDNYTEGRNYGYMLSTNVEAGFVWEDDSDVNSNSPLTITIGRINETKTSMTVYNDSVPGQTEFFKFAHMKGFLATDGVQGVYMMHSFPAYPSVDTNGNIDPVVADPHLMYGQYAFCSTVSASTVNDIASTIVISNPKVYAGTLLNNVSANGQQKGKTEIQTLGGEALTLVAHNGSLDTYYFENVLSPYLDASLQSQSWGRPYEQSFCSGAYDETNIHKLYGTDYYTWAGYNDHSKWSIAINQDTPITCMNDNNRMHSQNVRGGGSGCFNNQQVYEAFYKMSVEVFSCEEDKDVNINVSLDDNLSGFLPN